MPTVATPTQHIYRCLGFFVSAHRHTHTYVIYGRGSSLWNLSCLSWGQHQRPSAARTGYSWEQPARGGTQKKGECLKGGGVRSYHRNRQPYPPADGGGEEGIGGWVQRWRDPQMIICPELASSNNSFCVAEQNRWSRLALKCFANARSEL